MKTEPQHVAIFHACHRPISLVIEFIHRPISLVLRSLCVSTRPVIRVGDVLFGEPPKGEGKSVDARAAQPVNRTGYAGASGALV